MKPSLAPKLVGGLFIVMGVVLRVTVDGNLVQIPTVLALTPESGYGSSGELDFCCL
ncbi:hypothetical protein [Cryobacterium ruanii]|uniref:hypothetical protein n=1 Tax=Cryobacterium ruanii TaxID=1259197 RepID=UPI001A7E1F92|nr:hypothetical protein [Cryobacterium ruanii]